MPPKRYCCKSCGSREVYHHCTHTPSVAPTVAVKPVVARPIKKQSGPSNPTSARADVATALLQLSACEVKGCVRPMNKKLPGLRWESGHFKRVTGNALCQPCYQRFRDTADEYIPRPPGPPRAYIVARSRHRKILSRDEAIQLAWCFGNAQRAVNIIHNSEKRVAMNTL
jgi:hypothetical protein